MKYLSLFSGIGGFELGIKQAHESLCNVDGNEDGGSEENSSYDERQGFLAKERKKASSKERPISKRTSNLSDQRPLCIGYSEIDKYATQIYQKHFNHNNHGDITKIDEKELPDFELLCGGFPCQSFSIAGKRRGFNDTRGTMFFHIARILAEKRPRLLLLENVKGLLSHDQGRTFGTIIATLDELGYDLQWQVLNSKNFGVPQNRERVFIVGHLRGTPRPEVFPFGSDDQDAIRQSEEKLSSAKIARTITATEHKQHGDGNYIVQVNNPKHSNDRVYSSDGISPTLNTMQGGMRQPFVAPVLTPDRPTKRQNGRRFKENGEPSFTLTGQDKHGIYDGMKIRRLTPKECERLQGFPDNWTEGVSDTQRYKCIGNAVTVNVIRAIMEKLLVPSIKG